MRKAKNDPSGERPPKQEVVAGEGVGEGVNMQPETTPPGNINQQNTSNGMAVAALVLGIIAFLFGLIPFVGWLAFPLALMAVVFGGVGVSRANKTGVGKGMAVTGLVLGVLYFGWKVLWVMIIATALAAA